MWKTFHVTLQKNSAKRTIKSKDGKTEVAQVNQSTLSALNFYPHKIRKLLQCPLRPMLLRICYGDDARQK